MFPFEAGFKARRHPFTRPFGGTGPMRLHLFALVLGLASASAAVAEAPPSQMPPFGRSTFTQPVVIYDASGNVVSSFGGGGSTGGTVSQGTPGTAPWPVTWSGNPSVLIANFPASQAISNSFNLEATQQGVASSAASISTSNAAIQAAAGTTTDTATASGSATTMVGALRAIRDRLLGTLSTAITVFPSSSITTTGALQPPTAAAAKIVQTQVAVPATTSTTLIAANTSRIAMEIQCDGLATVGVDRAGGALTSATAAPLVIPSGAYPLYTMPIASQAAVTAYTGTAQTCRVTEYLR